MKILMLADPASVHTIKWANYLVRRGIEVLVFGLSNFDKNLYDEKIKIESFQFPGKIKQKSSGSIYKLFYLLGLNRLKKTIQIFNPDIIHAQYASSYGLLGALSGFHPMAVSVWGSDIYNFPYKSIIHKGIIKYILNRADRILSTSNVMAAQTALFTGKTINVIPFGIDISIFKPMKVTSPFSKTDVVIGTIKSLEKKYGIEYLVKAFKTVKENLKGKSLKLLIVGSGSQEYNLKKMVMELGLQEDTKFTGFVNPAEIPLYHNMIDVYAALSVEDSESFGVAILEASASGKPVVVTSVGGLPEVVKDNITGLIIKKENIEEAAGAITKLIEDAELRKNMGLNGREHVISSFNWEKNVEQLIEVYKCLI